VHNDSDLSLPVHHCECHMITKHSHGRRTLGHPRLNEFWISHYSRSTLHTLHVKRDLEFLGRLVIDFTSGSAVECGYAQLEQSRACGRKVSEEAFLVLRVELDPDLELGILDQCHVGRGHVCTQWRLVLYSQMFTLYTIYQSINKSTNQSIHQSSTTVSQAPLQPIYLPTNRPGKLGSNHVNQ
jgi:hypothetical protein